MRKILSLMALVAISSSTATSVVACSNSKSDAKTADTLNGKTFNVKLGSFTSPEAKLIYTKGADQWGFNSAGALYASLWSINNKPAQKHEDKALDYAFQNKDVAAYLTKGESFNRGADDGTNITVTRDGKTKTEAQIAKDDKLQNGDWHFDTIKNGDKIVIKADVSIYKKGTKGKEVEKTVKETITLNIVK